jgi:hypothetical protein
VIYQSNKQDEEHTAHVAVIVHKINKFIFMKIHSKKNMGKIYKLNSLIFIVVIFLPLEALSNNLGSLYISKIKINVSWEGNDTEATRSSKFTISVRGYGSQVISNSSDAHFQELALGQNHLISISLNGKRLQSFYFKFENYKCDKLWLYYKEMYGTWVLRESSYKCRR